MKWNSREVSGENHPNSKVSDLYRECIRESPAKGSTLARIFGLSESKISHIRRSAARETEVQS